MLRVLAVLVALGLVLVAFVASRPATFHIERSATLAAPADSVYARIADFHRWEAWSPWAKVDPAMKVDYSGAATGVGESYHWVGNDKVGEGRMTVTSVEPPDKLVIRLEFIKPFTSTNTCTFTLAPQGAGTQVTWAMDGNNNFVAKAMSLFMNMDHAVGPDFERGLASLGRVTDPSPAAETAPAPSGGGTTTP